MLYKTGVEYGDYTINHVLGCSHGCKYPCYAFMLAKRFGRVKTYDEWCRPVIANNTMDILKSELPKLRDKIKSIHLCFTTDPFMFGFNEISSMSLRIIEEIDKFEIPCTVLTKGVLPEELAQSSKRNSYGITLISLNEKYRCIYEPGSASYTERISALMSLHDKGFRTWTSIEPYPTPNIIDQDFSEILHAVEFVDHIVFGRLNYNHLVSEYRDYPAFYFGLARQVQNFCIERGKTFHIKKGTVQE